MLEYRVCILAAGRGSRVSQSDIINKALLPVGNETILSRIINKFPEHIEIVIPVGYRADQIRKYIRISFPQRKIHLVDIDHWEGPGSGPGYSLYACRNYLDCPFIFTSCDTLVLEDIPPPQFNWVGVASVEVPDPFCMVDVNEDAVLGFLDKLPYQDLLDACHSPDSILDHAFIGMAGVYDHETFFKGLEEGASSLVKNEWQVSAALSQLVALNIQCHSFTWYDTGTTENYLEADKLYNKGIVLNKTNEFLYIENGKVIKFFSDPDVVSKRMFRAKLLEGLIPEVSQSGGQFYGYDFIPGTMLSDISDRNVFENMLQRYTSSRLWEPVELNLEDQQGFNGTCMRFYRDKTLQRLDLLYQSTDIEDVSGVINGREVPAVKEMLAKLDWEWLSRGIPVLFHGDFQPENIIIKEDGKSVLLDWRQDFGGIRKYGDLYYDFAKLYHALLVNGEVIRQEQFSVLESSRGVTYRYLLKSNLLSFLESFETFVKDHSFDWEKVRILGILMFLNIAPLHHYPYSKFLYYLGRDLLYSCLEEKN